MKIVSVVNVVLSVIVICGVIFLGFKLDQVADEKTEYLSQDIKPLTIAISELKGQILAIMRTSSASQTQPVIIEAESFWRAIPKGNHYWMKQAKAGDEPAHLIAFPSYNKVFEMSSICDKSPVVEYLVHFDHPGTYYLWVRGKGEAGGASIVPGLEGKPLTGDVDFMGYFPYYFSWLGGLYDSSQRATLEITNSGDKIINFWIREDGFRFDKFIITVDAEYVPSNDDVREAKEATIITEKYSVDEIESYDPEYFFKRLGIQEEGRHVYAAMWALANKAKINPELKDSIIDRAIELFNTRKDTNVRWQCLSVLAEIKDKRGLPVVLKALKDDPDDTVRKMAAYSLLWFREFGVVPQLKEALETEKSPVVINSINATLKNIEKY